MLVDASTGSEIGPTDEYEANWEIPSVISIKSPCKVSIWWLDMLGSLYYPISQLRILITRYGHCSLGAPMI